jgi:hypothetical protein
MACGPRRSSPAKPTGRMLRGPASFGATGRPMVPWRRSPPARVRLLCGGSVGVDIERFVRRSARGGMLRQACDSRRRGRSSRWKCPKRQVRGPGPTPARPHSVRRVLYGPQADANVVIVPRAVDRRSFDRLELTRSCGHFILAEARGRSPRWVDRRGIRMSSVGTPFRWRWPRALRGLLWPVGWE